MAFNDIKIPPIVTTSVVWILHLNSVVNVIIYTLRRSDYRRAFVAVMRCTSLSRSNDVEHTLTNRTDNRDQLTLRRSIADNVSVTDVKNSASTIPEAC